MDSVDSLLQCTEEFLQAFNNLGLDLWDGCCMGPCHLAIWAAPPVHHWAYLCLQGLHHLGDDDT